MKDVREFLQEITVADLQQRGILEGTSNLLKGASVGPFIALVREHGVERLECLELNWSLDIYGNFQNPGSDEMKEGNPDALSSPGSIFNYANTTISPYYLSGMKPEEGEEWEARKLTFGLERDLQSALRREIEQLEPGLTIVDGGKERSVEGST